MASDGTARSGPPADRDHGSAMLLLPVAIIIVAMFAAVTINAAHAFLMQRELSATVDAVANDAVAGVDPDGIYRGEGITLFADDARLHAIIGRNLRGRIGDEVMLDSVEVTRVDNAGVEVAAAATVKPYFLQVLPIPDWTIRATARAYPLSSP